MCGHQVDKQVTLVVYGEQSAFLVEIPTLHASFPAIGLYENRTPGNTCIGGIAVSPALIQARTVIWPLLLVV